MSLELQKMDCQKARVELAKRVRFVAFAFAPLTKGGSPSKKGRTRGKFEGNEK